MAQLEEGGPTLGDVIGKVMRMTTYDNNAFVLARKHGLVVNKVSWEGI